ncbi:MAG: YbdK family carboxylate-amine ligase [Thermoleophilia bacterium]
MGDAQTLTPEEQLRLAREQFEDGDDLTLAIEEEFALLDPETLDMVNRFEDVQAAAQGSEVGDNMAGELIASEVEVKTGKCATFEEAARKLGERRGQLIELCDGLGLGLGATGAHPWAPWKEQRIIDTPHYRRNDEILRYVVWRNNTFGLHVHVGIRGADRAVQVANVVRTWLPDLLALSASSPFVEDVYTYLHSTRSQVFTKMFPRCGIPDTFADWADYERFVGLLYQTGSVTEHTQLWWSVRLHLQYPDRRDPHLRWPAGAVRGPLAAALCYALAARVARAIDEGEPLLVHRQRLLEENFWRAIRHGLSGELLDLDRFEEGRVRPARAAVEELIEWVMPVARELGVAPYLAVPGANAAERQIARLEEGATLREIYAEQVARTRDVGAGVAGA